MVNSTQETAQYTTLPHSSARKGVEDFEAADREFESSRTVVDLARQTGKSIRDIVVHLGHLLTGTSADKSKIVTPDESAK